MGRCCGVWEPSFKELIELCCFVCWQCLKNDSTDVKQLVGRMLCFVADSQREGSGDNHAGLSPEVLRVVVPALVMGTKEKNTMVRATSELAIVMLLGLRHGDQLYQVMPAGGWGQGGGGQEGCNRVEGDRRVVTGWRGTEGL